jgi:hypothetical protein
LSDVRTHQIFTTAIDLILRVVVPINSDTREFAMKLYTPRDGWDALYDDITFTTAMLEAGDTHTELSKPLARHATRWMQIDADRRTAAVALVKADARVSWCDLTLDRCTTRFATYLLADCSGDRTHDLFVAFFPTAPGDVTRLRLESQLETMKQFPAMPEADKLERNTRAHFQHTLDAMAKGQAALQARDAARTAMAMVSRRQTEWRDEANVLRRNTATGLEQHAIKNTLPRTYGNNFFAPTKSAKKAAEKVVSPQPAVAPTSADVEHILALPDRIIGALAEDFVATLPANVQSIVRARRAS